MRPKDMGESHADRKELDCHIRDLSRSLPSQFAAFSVPFKASVPEFHITFDAFPFHHLDVLSNRVFRTDLYTGTQRRVIWRAGGDNPQGPRPTPLSECELDDNADKNGATNIAKKGLGKDIACPLSSLGAVCEPALEPSGADQASITVRLRADLEASASTKQVVRRRK